MRTLIFDTSGPYATVAVAEDDALTAYASFRIKPLQHLHGMAQTVTAQLGMRVADAERIAVVTGPGSWTGLNIGVTAAKTLAQVLALPVVELGTLDALVADRRWVAGPVCALLDAKRANVYCGLYPTAEDGSVLLREGELEMLPIAELNARLAAGDGRPLVVEYGDTYRRDLESEHPRACVCRRGAAR